MPSAPSHLLYSFLRRLWLYSPQARNPSCSAVPDSSWPGTCPPSLDEGIGEDLSAVNPLDLITGVFMCSNSFLRQEIARHMVRCNFAVPLLLPPIWPDVHGTLLLWPFRGVLGQWKPNPFRQPQEMQMKNMASSRMPLLSCVRLGDCNVSKSQVLNRLMSGPHKQCEFFIHRHMEGGQLPRSLSEGVVEIGWNLPVDDPSGDMFSRPMLMSNLRGDAASFDRQLSLLCRGSAVLIVLCGSLGDRECELLAYWRSLACHMVLVDCPQQFEDVSASEGHKKRLSKMVKELELDQRLLLSNYTGNEEELALCLKEALSHLIPHLHAVNLVDLAGISMDLSFNVDEDDICRKAYKEAEEVLKGIEEDPVKYKEEQLPLQGAQWKRLVELEKEECRPVEDDDFDPPEVEEEKRAIQQDLRKYKLTSAMKGFIDALTTINTFKRAFFLKWMEVQLGVMQWEQFSASQCTEPMETTSAGNYIFLGVEHFFREMGLMYELCHHSACSDSYVLRLPNLAAELLMHGVPLEIYDGDASAVPMNWLYSVLVQLQKKLPLNMRMKVITAFGLHDSKNAEVLSTLFGTSFPKGTYRHAKGAYMLLLVLPDNLRWEMECDLLLLINTEGLNFPSEQEDSLEHDHELATFVTGLSDVMLLNLKADSENEVQSTLQIAVSALLRTKETEKMPACLIMTQNDKLDTRVLSLQMSRVIQVLNMDKSPQALEIENVPRTENNSHCLMAPWNNNIVYSPVNPEGTKAMLDLKSSLFHTTKECAVTNQDTRLPQFTESISQLWEAVKRENFPIPFNNTEIAVTFSGVCTKLVYDEQNIQNHMEGWIGGVDGHITDLKEGRRGARRNSEDILRKLEDDASSELNTECDRLRAGLKEYFKREDINWHLVDAYHTNFLNTVDVLQMQSTNELNKKLEFATDVYEISAKTKALQTALEAALEVKLRLLLISSRTSDDLLDDIRLEEEFASVWDQVPTNLEQKPVEQVDIADKVKQQLRENLRVRVLQKYIDKLELVGKQSVGDFTVLNEHFGFRSKLKRTLQSDKEEAPAFAAKMIDACDESVLEKVKRKENYSNSYTKDLLEIIDRGLSSKEFNVNSLFEIDLKVYVCNKASLSFKEMQDKLVRQMNSKKMFLMDNKQRYMQDFKQQYRSRHQCLKAAQAFTSMCLKPAAQCYIEGSMGIQIFTDILRKDELGQLCSPKQFHYNVLKELMQEDSFESFYEYLQSSENFIRKRILQIVVNYFSGTVMLEDSRQQCKDEVISQIEQAINQSADAMSGEPDRLHLLLLMVCNALERNTDLVLERDMLKNPLFDFCSHHGYLLTSLRDNVAELSSFLDQELMKSSSVVEISQDLPSQLQNKLYERIKGCGKRCPFCKAPCDVEDRNHTVHSSLWHRPKDLLPYACSGSYNTCSEEMRHDSYFSPNDDNDQIIAYKDYQSIYPDWSIPQEHRERGGSSIYWRYVMMRHNDRFAQAFQCEPAVLPQDWITVHQQEALESLRKAFQVE
ncbi:up-regulator of cell proliferation [Denticeps clupeoides]|nr:up-regulator of cell proliferation-like [Denticeps clupeoides]